MNPTETLSRHKKTADCMATELEGYVDLGMARQARRLARQILSKTKISSDEFCEAIRAIGVFSDFEKWTSQIEAAYQRQSRLFRKQCRSAMLSFYFALEDAEKAAEYLSCDRTPTPADAFFSMSVLLELGRLKEAKPLARKMGRLINRVQEPAYRAFLIEGVARYCAHVRKWDTAAEVWSWAPLDQPFRFEALVGQVHLHLARALEQTCYNLRVTKKVFQNPNLDDEIIIPGNEDGLTGDTEKELLKLKRQLEKLLPEARRKELGFSLEGDAGSMNHQNDVGGICE